MIVLMMIIITMKLMMMMTAVRMMIAAVSEHGKSNVSRVLISTNREKFMQEIIENVWKH